MQCNEMLKSDDLSVREIIKRSKVEVICTTDDPVDDLMYHRKIQGTRVLTSRFFLHSDLTRR